MRRDGGSVFPAHANTGDPNGPNRGLSANENARALISMMARSKCSNQRPDTLMQDRSPPARRNHLQRTAGPYIWVKSGPLRVLARCPLYPDEQTSASASIRSEKCQERKSSNSHSGSRNPTQANGRIFWFIRKKFFESYFVFTSWSRR